VPSEAQALRVLQAEFTHALDEAVRRHLYRVVGEVLGEVERQGAELPPGLASRVATAVAARVRLDEDTRVRAALLRALGAARRL
jgi:hypothetical protein